MSVPRSIPGGFAARTMVTALATALLTLIWAPRALAVDNIVPLAPFVSQPPSCDDPNETVSYLYQDGVVWNPATAFTVPPQQTKTAVASAAEGSTLDPTAQNEFPFTNSFDPAATCPPAAPDTFTIWLGHKYDLTAKMLKNDVAPEGCTPQISAVRQIDGFLNGTVKYHKAAHTVTVLSWRQAHKPKTLSFTYTYACEESGLVSNTATDKVTVRPTWKMRVKLLSHHRYKVINRNDTYFMIRTWKPGGRYLLKPYRVPAHSSKIKTRLHVSNVVGAWLGKYKAPMGYHAFRPW